MEGMGLLHMALYYILKWYSGEYGIAFDGWIIELPFGFILKWCNGTSKQEAATM